MAALEQAPRDCFRAAFRLGLIDRDARWIAMVEDRNRTTHAYDAETARKGYEALRTYAGLFDSLLARLVEGEHRRRAEERP
jgi:nucleotidyltransferase substrate binding protein (TIGR01987 family)